MTDDSGFQLAGSAPERYERYVAPIMAPFVEALLDAANLRDGSALLDVACGTGFAARRAARRVGPSGTIVGIDINAGMLEVARTASDASIPAIEWQDASASRIPYPDASFDAVICQQGLQFVSELDAAVAEMARTARPGATIAATVWSPLERSPYFHAQAKAIESLLCGAADSFAAAFSCSAERLSAAFADAGLGDVTAREVVAEIVIDSIRDYVPAHLMALPWGASLAEAREGGIAEASRIILDQLRELIDGDSLTAPFASMLVVARR
jgi:SAM-dependent methyltransferase